MQNKKGNWERRERRWMYTKRVCIVVDIWNLNGKNWCENEGQMKGYRKKTTQNIEDGYDS
jgi:hypothetical protein